MSDYLQTKFQYYPASVYETTPLGICTLYDMLNAIKNPRKEIEVIFKEIEKASAEKNKKRKDELKTKLYYFNPCILTDGLGRKYTNIVSFSGILLVDIDNLEADIAISLKKYLFETYDFVIASFLSVSKLGVKLLIRCPISKTVDEFKSYFYGLMVNWQWIEGMDLAPQNPSLPAYLTYDRELLMREDATVFSERGVKIDEFKEYIGDPIEVEATEDDRIKIISILKRSFDKIDNSGHFICRSGCLAGWGYCGAGYFTEDEMQEILFELIDDTPYLQSKLKNYKQTCLDMKRIGISAPLTLKENG